MNSCICTPSQRADGWVTSTCPEHDPLESAQREALIRHGYDPDLPPRGVGGPPDEVITVRRLPEVDGEPRWRKLRNRVCYLDGIKIEGHEGSDLDPGSTACIHCRYEGSNP